MATIHQEFKMADSNVNFSDLLSSALDNAGTAFQSHLNEYAGKFHDALSTLSALAGTATDLSTDQLQPLVQSVVDTHNVAITDFINQVGHLFVSPGAKRNVFLPQLSALQSQLAESLQNPLSALQSLVVEAGQHLLSQHNVLSTSLLGNVQDNLQQLAQSVSSPEQ